MLPLQFALEHHFGHSRFRPMQREIIETVLAGQDVLAVLPTGAGKSLCYQLPSLLLPNTTVVVSPLLALMRDQVASLERRGVPGVFQVSANQPAEDNARALQAISDGRARLVFAAPERFASRGLTEALKAGGVSLFVVDEAHCVCQWGHDFRPDYLRLSEVIRELAPSSVLALTATATPRVRHLTLHELGLRDPQVQVGPIDRSNLYLAVEVCTSQQRLRRLGQLLHAHGSLPALVYVSLKRDAQRVAEHLQGRGLPALPYHAGMSPGLRAANQEDFLTGRVPVLVATVAFGMGVDKPDVRSVVHFQAPGSLEAYYQEAGRAGRDGGPARCTVLHDPLDADILRSYCERRYPGRDDLHEVHLGLCSVPPATLRNRFPTWPDTRWNLAVGALLGRGYDRRARPERVASVPAAWLRIRALCKADQERTDRMLDYLETSACRRSVLLPYFGEEPPAECPGCDNCRPACRSFPRPGLRVRVRQGEGSP
ncbi:MAG: ATP-dependent DNA helicase RecQ [Candidatus Eremiobacterota bacterium]